MIVRFFWKLCVFDMGALSIRLFHDKREVWKASKPPNTL